MATIRDIAKAIGLSPATISRSLNNDSSISEATRTRVLIAANEMNYTGSSRRRNRQENHIIGIICPEIISYNYASVAESLSRHLRKKGFESIMMITGMESYAEKAALETLNKLHISGVVLIMYEDETSRMIMEEFRNKCNIPIVQISNFCEYDGYDSLMISNRQAVEVLIDHLYELGHRDIGIITDNYALLRLDIACNYLQKLGILPNRNRRIIVPTERFEQAGYTGAMQLLRSDDRPSAIIAMYDYIAIGVLRACDELGIRVPEDISVVGIDNINTSAYTQKALTTVSMPHADMGRIAARLIVDRIQEGKNHSAIQHVSLMTDLIVRETTSAPAQDHSGGA